MKKLHLLVLRSFIGPFILIFFVVLFVLLMQFLWRYIDELVGKGLSVGVIAQLLLYTSTTLVPMALPLSILMSSLMTFGNLGEKYELTAIKASGISLQRIMKPIVILVFFMSVGAFFFANDVLPYANLQMRSLLYDIRQQRPELQINQGEFNSSIDGYSIRVDKKDPETNMLYGVKIYDHTNDQGNVNVTIADSGSLVSAQNNRTLIFTLYNGSNYTELQYNPENIKVARRKRTYPHQYVTFTERQFMIDLVGFDLQRTDQSLFKGNYSVMNLEQLNKMQDSLNLQIETKFDQLFTSLVKGNYFKRRNYRTSSNSNSRNKTPGIPYTNGQHREMLTNQGVYQLDSTRKLVTNRLIGTEHMLPDSIKNLVTEKTEPNDSIKEAENKSLNIESNKDTIAHIFDFDSLFNTFTFREKDVIYSSALQYARSAKNYVVSSAQSLDYKIEHLRRFEIERQRKFTIAFACLLFLFIGAPLGAIIRKGGMGLPLVLSTLFFIFYYIASLTGEKMVRENILPDFIGMWVASSIFLVAGIFLTYKATTDSSMLNMDTYTNFFKKLFGQKYNLVDTLQKQTSATQMPLSEASVKKIQSTLRDLESNIDGLLDSLGEQFKVQISSDLILFERLYKNIFRTIIFHPLFNNRPVREKLLQFPNFSFKSKDGVGIILLLVVILALIPFIIKYGFRPSYILISSISFIALLIIRHITKLNNLRSKLKQIKILTNELKALIWAAENEDPSTDQ